MAKRVALLAQYIYRDPVHLWDQPERVRQAQRRGEGAAQCFEHGNPIAVSTNTYTLRLNMELDLQTLFGLLCTAVLRYSLAELQRLLSGVHSIMKVKLAQAGKCGGARTPPFIPFTITSKVAVYASAEWADTLTLFHL